MDFGQRVKELRRKHKLTKEEFCGDETELSVRQLTRIESGQSTPTLAKVEFIAQRLGVIIGELTDDNFELPERYKEIKFLLLYTQTYRENEKIAVRQQYFDEIYDSFFEQLPEEEQLVVEILESHLEIFVKQESYVATKLLKEYLGQVAKKVNYNINDLIILNLYFHYMQTKDADRTLYDERTHYRIIENLLAHSDKLSIDKLFLLNRVLIIAFGTTKTLTKQPYAAQLITAVEANMTRSQDFQKMPILNLMKWKFALFYQNDSEMADNYFKSACLFAELTQDKHLLANLKREWQKDFGMLSVRL